MMIINVLFLLGAMGEYVFFIIMMLLGITYEGSNDSNIYRIYWFLILITVFLLSMKLLISRYKNKINIIIGLYIFTFITILVFGISLITAPASTLNIQYGLYLMVFGAPSFLIGVISSDQRYRKRLGRVLIFIMPIGTIALLLNMIALDNVDYFASAGGLSRLGAGYMAAQFSIIALYLLLNKGELQKNNKKLFYRILSQKSVLIIILLLQMLFVLYSASRGPFVALILAIMLQIILVGQISGKHLIKYFLYLCTILTILYLVVFRLKVEFLDSSISRIKSLFGTNTSIDVTNGRADLYKKAFELFLESPIYGHGPMGFLTKSGYSIYPHNIFMEILCDYGLIGFVGLMSLLIYILYKYYINLKVDWTVCIVFGMFSVKLIELMFSGSFITSGQFWFFIGFGLFLPMNPKRGIG